MSNQVHATETYWVTKVAKLEADIQRVRDLHKPNDDNECSVCACGVWNDGELEYERYPCPTLRALDGEQA